MTRTGQGGSTDAGFRLLAQAQAAARSGNASAMIEALMASGFLDGLVRKLSFIYPDLDCADVDDVVAAAAGDAFEAIRKGRAVTQLGGFISRAASNRANDKWENDYVPRRSAEHLPEGSTEDGLEDGDRSRADDLADHRRDEAVRLARQLLPQVGQYRDSTGKLAPNDSAGRSAAKASARAATPPITRGVVEGMRPGLGPKPGSGGTANRTNVGADRLAGRLGTAGRVAGVAGVAIGVARVATSDNPGQEAARVGGGMAGAIAGAEGGAIVGALGGPWGAAAGGIVGGLVGGFAGEKAVDKLLDW